MTREAILMVTRVWITRVRVVSQEKRDQLETKLSWPTDRMFATAVAGAGAVDVAGAVAKTVDAAGAVAETTVVAVTRVGAAAQWAKEPQAHAENLATSATAASIFGVSAQNSCVSTAKKRDMNTLPDLAYQCRTQELNSERSWFTFPFHRRPCIRGKET